MHRTVLLFLCHTTHHVSGIEISAGSLGHGFSIACGIALGAKIKKENFNTYVILGDGEMDEGSNWEAFLLERIINYPICVPLLTIIRFKVLVILMMFYVLNR